VKPLGVLMILLGAVVFYLRWNDQLRLSDVILVSTLFLLTAIVISLALNRKNWEKKENTAHRIDDSLSLHNRLSLAELGKLSWPKKQETPSLFSWKLSYFLTPLLIGATGIALGALIPIHKVSDKTSNIQEPQSWTELEEELEELKEEDIIQEDYVEKKEEELAELRSQSPDEWYDHSSLEAWKEV